MKTRFLTSLLLILPALALAQSDIIPLVKKRSDGTLTDGVKTGAKTMTISATGTLEWINGATLTGASYFREAAGLTIGTDIQAYDADLTTWAGITPSANVQSFLGTPTKANLDSAISATLATTGANSFTDTQTITKTTGLTSATPQLNLVGYGATISSWYDSVGGSLGAWLNGGDWYARSFLIPDGTVALDGPNGRLAGHQSMLITWTGGGVWYTTVDLTICRAAAATLQLGVNDATTPTKQIIKAHNVTTGTGADLELRGGTGSVADGGVAIGNGGAAIHKILTATATLNFDLTAAVVEDLTITVTGAAVGDVVMLGVPHGSMTTTSQFSAWVSASNTVTVRCRTSANGEDPASGTFRATIIQH